MQELKKFIVDSVTYQIQELLATERNILILEVVQLAGGAASGIGVDDDIDFGKMISGFMKNGNPREMAEFIKQTILGSLAFPKLDDNSFEVHFQEHYSHQIDVLEQIFILNYGPPINHIKKKLANSAILGKIFSIFKATDTTLDSKKSTGSSGKSVLKAKKLSAT